MSFTPSDLQASPLFQNIPEAQLERLVSAFERRALPSGAVLFEPGQVPDRLMILIQGEVQVREAQEDRYLLKPVTPIGELALLTGIERVFSAAAVSDIEVLEVREDRLRGFLEQNGEVAYLFHRNMLIMAARKIARDRRRMSEMRANLIATQKSMKRMREALLDSEDNPLHASLYEELDSLIEHNRKGHYLVEPSGLMPTRVRLDDGRVVRILSLSNEWLHYERASGPADPREKVKGDWSGVMLLGDREIAVSGTIEAVTERSVEVFLDELIEESARALEDHLNRLQMLDIVL